MARRQVDERGCNFGAPAQEVGAEVIGHCQGLKPVALVACGVVAARFEHTDHRCGQLAGVCISDPGQSATSWVVRGGSSAKGLVHQEAVSNSHDTRVPVTICELKQLVK